MAHQGGSQRPVVIQVPRCRRKELEGASGLDGKVPAGSDGKGRENGPKTPVGHPKRHHAQSNQCHSRINQRDNPED
jgi:hypothetical protein